MPESTFGDSADFVGDYTWVDGGYFYDLDDFDVTVDEHVLAPVVGVLSTFDGIDKSGVWTLEIGDYAADDTGTLGSWNIVMNNIPAPGALALLGLAGCEEHDADRLRSAANRRSAPPSGGCRARHCTARGPDAPGHRSPRAGQAHRPEGKSRLSPWT